MTESDRMREKGETTTMSRQNASEPSPRLSLHHSNHRDHRWKRKRGIFTACVGDCLPNEWLDILSIAVTNLNLERKGERMPSYFQFPFYHFSANCLSVTDFTLYNYSIPIQLERVPGDQKDNHTRQIDSRWETPCPRWPKTDSFIFIHFSLTKDNTKLGRCDHLSSRLIISSSWSSFCSFYLSQWIFHCLPKDRFVMRCCCCEGFLVTDVWRLEEMKVMRLTHDHHPRVSLSWV